MANEMTWVPCTVKPRHEGPYKLRWRRGNGSKLPSPWFYFYEGKWGNAAPSKDECVTEFVQKRNISGKYTEDCEYLLDESAPDWIPTDGKRPDLPEGTMVHVRLGNGGEHKGRVEMWNWITHNPDDDITHYRLADAPKVNPHAKHWGVNVDACLLCGKTAMRVKEEGDNTTCERHPDSVVPKINVAQEATRETANPCGRSEPPAAAPFRIHRDPRFGLLVKYPAEPKSRLVGEFPFNTWRIK